MAQAGRAVTSGTGRHRAGGARTLTVLRALADLFDRPGLTLRARYVRALRILPCGLPAERCTLALYSGRQGALRVVAARGPVGAEPCGVEEAFRSGRLVRRDEPDSELHLPLPGTAGRPFGVLSVCHAGPHVYGPDDELFLGIVADRMAAALSRVRLARQARRQEAMAIERARVYVQATQLVTELTALRETSLDLASQLDVQQVLERVVERASHLLGARGGVLFLATADGNALRAAISRVPWADYTGLTLRLGEGLAGRVAQTGQPAIVNDYQHWPERVPAAIDSPLTAAVCIPLRWAGQVLGVLNIMDDQPNRAFTGDDLELLAQLSPQAGLSIRNAQLYTELERHIEELRQTQAQLVRSEKLAALGRLAASIAHEVNNPLQSIRNCLELCQRPALGAAKRAEYLALAEEEVERVVTIVQRLLDFYRPAQEGRMATQVNDVLNDVLALANKQLEHARVRVRRVLDPALPRLAAIPAHLKQVFLNLILNAVEAMPGGGELCVTTHRLSSGWLAVEFADTGTGIASADLPQIFEPFFTSKTKGSGLGLAVSYGIVQAHGGTLEVNSEVGAGSTFTVKLPIVAEGAHD